ncbi:MAG: hypothetical protein E7253_02205 [Lachnospiraceae bacterium]|nr:hypothetical protein [Lachnospiraceae bacterium]
MNETQEYLEIMAGRKRLELEYKTGDVVSGYTAYGLHARIIESLHCGQYIDGWGFLVDREFEDGDIARMKRHYFEWKEIEEMQKALEDAESEHLRKEKEKLLEGVSWVKKENLQLYGGVSYIHTIRIENEEFRLEEKRISGMGRVIVPLYEVAKDILGDSFSECIDDRWYWSYIKEGREEKLLMSGKEERAYLIVYRYGMLV